MGIGEALVGEFAGLSSGDLLQFLQQTVDSAAKNGQRAVRLKPGYLTRSLSAYVVAHPDLADKISDRDETVKGGGVPNSIGRIQRLAFFPLYGSMFQAWGEDHRLQRKAITPALTHTHVARIYAGAIKSATADVLAGLGSGNAVEVRPLIGRFTAGVIANTLIQDPAGRKQLHDIAAVSNQLVADIVKGFSPNPLVNMQGQWGKLMVSRRLGQMVDAVLTTAEKHEGGRDLISLLLGAVESDDMSRLNLVRNLATLFVAGHETTSSVSEWIFVVLDQFPHMLAKLQEEVQSAGKSFEEMELPDFKQLKYLDAFVRELLRLYSAALLRLRKVGDPIENIPAGSLVILPVRSLNVCTWLDPENPYPLDEFHPERWFAAGSPIFQTFGWGTKVCIGRELTFAELKYLVFALVRAYSQFNVVNRRNIHMIGLTTASASESPLVVPIAA